MAQEHSTAFRAHAGPEGRCPGPLPGQQSSHGCEQTNAVKHWVAHQRLHGPVGVGGRVARRAGSIVNQSHGEK